MNRIILAILLSLSVFVMSGCKNSPEINQVADSAYNISHESGSATDTILDAEKIALSDRFYDFGKIQMYKNRTYLSAKIRTEESDFYYKVINVQSNDTYDISDSSEVAEDIASSGNKVFTLGYSSEDSLIYFISRYTNGVCDKKIQSSGNRIACTNDCLISYGSDNISIYDMELNEKKHFEVNEYLEYIYYEFYVTVDKDLNLYIISYDKEKNKYSLLKINSQGNKEYVSDDFNDLSSSCTGEITGFFINNNMLYISAESRIDGLVMQYINIIDPQTGKTSERTEIENALLIRNGDYNYDFTYSDENSIYGYNMDRNQSVCLYTNPEGFSYKDHWDINESGLKVYEMKYDDELSSSINVILGLDAEDDIVSVFPSDIQYFFVNKNGLYFLTEESSCNDKRVIKLNCTQDGINYEPWWQTEINDDINISNFHIAENNIIFLCSIGKQSIIYNYDLEGNFVGEIEYEYEGVSTVTVIDGELCVIYKVNDTIFSAEINVYENIIESEKKITSIPENVIFLEKMTEDKTEILYYDTQNNIVYTYNGKSFDICIDLSGFSVFQVIDLFKASDGEYWITGCDYEGSVSFWKTRKTECSDVDIKISGYNIPYVYREAAKKYEEYNSDVNIYFEDYSKYNTDNNEGFDKLNSDIASGKIPDIIITDVSFDFNKYAEKQLFYDMRADLSADDSISFQDYSDFAFRYKDGELLQVIPMTSEAYIFTLPHEEINHIQDFDSLTDYYSSNNIRCSSIEKMEKMIVSAFITDNLKNENFEIQTLCRVLEGLKKQYSGIENINEDAALICSSFYSYIHEMEKNSGDIATVELAGDTYIVSISEFMGLSVSKESENKEKAIGFVKYILSDDVQSMFHIEEGTVPSNKNAFKSELENMMNPECRNLVADVIKKSSYSKMLFDLSGSALYDIIINEIHEYYMNGSTEEQTAELIKKKIKLYLSETE